MRTLALAILSTSILAACGDDTSKQTDAAIPAENHPPTVAALTLTTIEDQAVTHELVTSDPDGDDVVITFGTPMHGSVARVGTSVTYTPAANYVGSDEFAVTVGDGKLTATAMISVIIEAANDAPVAMNDSFAAAEDVPSVIPPAMVLANDTDIDGDPLTVASVGSAIHGTVTLGGNGITFTPAANYNGVATFVYVASDGTATDSATVMLTVNNVNDPPVAFDDVFTMGEDTTAMLTSPQLTANDTDADGQTLSIIAASATLGTTVVSNGTISFTPPANYAGNVTITYTASDGLASDTANVMVTVTAVDDPPVAGDDATTMAEDATVLVPFATYLANDSDIDGPTPSITSTSNASHVTATVGATGITIVAEPDFAGTAGFDYTLTAGTATDIAHVTVTITPENDAPVAGDDAVSVQADQPTNVPFATLLANDTDIDTPHANLTITGVTAMTNCAAIVNATSLTLTCGSPATMGSVTYTVSDGAAADSGVIAVTISMGAVCGNGSVTGGEACDDGNLMPGDGCNATCQVENGFACINSPSVCTTTCGDSIVAGTEQCDNGGDDLDGCTSACKTARACNATAIAGGAAYAVDATTGACYVGFRTTTNLSYAASETACESVGGHLAVISSAGEDAIVASVAGAGDNAWIGAQDDAVDLDMVFAWVTGEPFGYSHFTPPEPDDDGECLHLLADGSWGDASCAVSATIKGRVCEIPLAACGDRVVEAGETCDDGNTTSLDGCDATCHAEQLAFWSFTGAPGNQVSSTADTFSTALTAAPVITRGSGVAGSAGADSINSTGWSTTVFDANDYYELTLTPKAAESLNAFKLVVDERRSGTGITMWSVRSSIDNYATDITTFTVPDDANTRRQTIVLPAATFGALTMATTFRIFGFGAEGATGSWRLSRVEVLGIATP